MAFYRARMSAAVAWVMIPLAIWAGMPSTGCVCANGRFKFFCEHLLSSAKNRAPAAHLAGCESHCCGSTADLTGDEHDADCEHDTDCCGSGFCCRGSQSTESGIGSKACCKPILTAPSVVSEVVSAPCDQMPAVVATVEQVGAIVHPSFRLDVAEFDTGPPLDRVIAFRSLLI